MGRARFKEIIHVAGSPSQGAMEHQGGHIVLMNVRDKVFRWQ